MELGERVRADEARLAAEWAERNCPTFWNEEPPARALGVYRPIAQDRLWFRIQMIYAPIVVTDPKSILKVTSVA